MAITKAVFVEVWRLAPMRAAQEGDAIGWVRAIAARRMAERSTSDPRWPAPDDRDARTGRELTVTLDGAGSGGPAVARARAGRRAGCGQRRPSDEPRV